MFFYCEQRVRFLPLGKEGRRVNASVSTSFLTPVLSSLPIVWSFSLVKRGKKEGDRSRKALQWLVFCHVKLCIWGSDCTLWYKLLSEIEPMYLWNVWRYCQLPITHLNLKWLLEPANWELSLRCPDICIFLFPAEREDNVNAYSLKFTDGDSEGSDSWPVQARKLTPNQSLSIRVRARRLSSTTGAVWSFLEKDRL